MASWTTPVTHSEGEDLAVTDWNGVANNTTFLYQAPYIMAYNSSSTSLTNSTNVQLTLGGLTASGYGWTVSSNNIVPPLTGIYSIAFSVQGAQGSGFLQSSIYHNGTQVLTGNLAVTGTSALSGGGSLAGKLYPPPHHIHHANRAGQHWRGSQAEPASEMKGNRGLYSIKMT
jgi:hypothetical protein